MIERCSGPAEMTRLRVANARDTVGGVDGEGEGMDGEKRMVRAGLPTTWCAPLRASDPMVWLDP